MAGLFIRSVPGVLPHDIELARGDATPGAGRESRPQVLRSVPYPFL